MGRKGVKEDDGGGRPAMPPPPRLSPPIVSKETQRLDTEDQTVD